MNELYINDRVYKEVIESGELVAVIHSYVNENCYLESEVS